MRDEMMDRAGLLGPGFDSVLKVMEEASSFGTLTSENGARLYGHVPHVAPQAWFHILFPPLNSADVEYLEMLGRPVPPSYRDLLARTNGLYLFSGALSLHGLRRDYSRRAAIVEPFHLGDPNLWERPKAATPGWFIFAFYKDDGSQGYLDPISGQVYRGSRDLRQPRLNEWASLDQFLGAEASRLKGHFDERGRRLDGNRPNTPPN